jgi:LacI family transcriptional regulator
VIQGSVEMGRTAAHLLHQMLHGRAFRHAHHGAAGHQRAGLQPHEVRNHPHVMQALHFIRQYACQGIKTDQVADYVGISRSSLEWYFRRELAAASMTKSCASSSKPPSACWSRPAAMPPRLR